MNEMKEIANRFCLLTPELVQDSLLMHELVVPDANRIQFPAIGKVLFSQSPSETDGGVVWNQTFRAVTADPAVLRYRDASLYPAFFMTDGTLRVVGSHDSVPTVTVAPYDGGRYLVQSSFQAREALIL